MVFGILNIVGEMLLFLFFAMLITEPVFGYWEVMPVPITYTVLFVLHAISTIIMVRKDPRSIWRINCFLWLNNAQIQKYMP